MKDIEAWVANCSFQKCSLAARAFWLLSLHYMQDEGSDSVSGTLAELARAYGSSDTEILSVLNELSRNSIGFIDIIPNYVRCLADGNAESVELYIIRANQSDAEKPWEIHGMEIRI